MRNWQNEKILSAEVISTEFLQFRIFCHCKDQGKISRVGQKVPRTYRICLSRSVKTLR